MEYAIDAFQRSILFWDVMNQRGNQYREHAAETVPHVLDYKAELVVDGRTLERPVNYALVRVVPPRESRSIPSCGPLLSLIRAPGMGPALAASKRTAKSA